MKRNSKKGFTLAELLIVVAIIAVLIAIMFPVFGAQLDKARAAAELANVRAKYSELVADAMLGTTNNIEDIAVSGITIKVADLQAACTDQTNTVVTATDPNGTTEGSVTVTYKENYTGTFKTDADVKFSRTNP